MIDTSSVKVGDTILFAGTVDRVHPPFEGRYKFRVAVPGTLSQWVPNELIVGHAPAPKPFEPGDVVKFSETGGHGVIRSLDNGEAWITDEAGYSYIRPLEDLSFLVSVATEKEDASPSAYCGA